MCHYVLAKQDTFFFICIEIKVAVSILKGAARLSVASTN